MNIVVSNRGYSNLTLLFKKRTKSDAWLRIYKVYKVYKNLQMALLPSQMLDFEFTKFTKIYKWHFYQMALYTPFLYNIRVYKVYEWHFSPNAFKPPTLYFNIYSF